LARMADEQREAFRNEAATRIQAVARGRAARKEVKARQEARTRELAAVRARQKQAEEQLAEQLRKKAELQARINALKELKVEQARAAEAEAVAHEQAKQEKARENEELEKTAKAAAVRKNDGLEALEVADSHRPADPLSTETFPGHVAEISTDQNPAAEAASPVEARRQAGPDAAALAVLLSPASLVGESGGFFVEEVAAKARVNNKGRGFSGETSDAGASDSESALAAEAASAAVARREEKTSTSASSPAAAVASSGVGDETRVSAAGRPLSSQPAPPPCKSESLFMSITVLRCVGLRLGVFDAATPSVVVTYNAESAETLRGNGAHPEFTPDQSDPMDHAVWFRISPLDADVSLQVFDAHKYLGKSLVGSVDVLITDLQTNLAHTQTYEVRNKRGVVQGQVVVYVTFAGKPSPRSTAMRARVSVLRAKAAPPLALQEHNVFYVIPMEARNLHSADASTGRADPYCKVVYRSAEAAEVQSRQTHSVPLTLHPVWAWSMFMFDTLEVTSSSRLEFQVFDHDHPDADDLMGEAVVDVKAVFAHDRVYDAWLDLTMKRQVVGHLHVRIYPPQLPRPVFHEESMGQSLFLFDEAEAKMKTGDMIIYSGSEFVSGVIKKRLHMPYSHVGLVLRMCDPLHPGEEPQVFLAEADWDDGDYLTPDEGVCGIIFNQFQTRMRKYAGDVIWHCPLREALTAEEEQQMIQYAMRKKREKVVFNLKAGAKIFFGLKNTECKDALFCSEFVAYALQTVGRMDAAVNCSAQTPFSLSLQPCYDCARPSTCLRYQVEVDQAKIDAAGSQEIEEMLFGNAESKADPLEEHALAVSPLSTVSTIIGSLKLSCKVDFTVATYANEDIYIRLTHGNQVKVSMTERVGVDQQVQQELTLNLVHNLGSEKVRFQVFSYHKVLSDKLLGEGSVFLSTLVNEGLEMKLAAPKKPDVKVGQIKIKSHLVQKLARGHTRVNQRENSKKKSIANLDEKSEASRASANNNS